MILILGVIVVVSILANEVINPCDCDSNKPVIEEQIEPTKKPTKGEK